MNVTRIFIFILIISFSFSFSVFADESVNGYYRKDGTYVQPYHRSSPNNTENDNWSTKGNINPYTGKEGTKNPDNNLQNNY